ncbi:MAG: ArsR/SmtB family transcription factor [Pseudomonadales bacterium]
MPRAESVRSAPRAEIFAALGDQHRLRLIDRLCESGPMSITALSGGTAISRQAVTKHLHRLEQAGLVHSHRQGRERLWQVEPASIDDAQRYLEHISARWDAAIDRLRRYVET